MSGKCDVCGDDMKGVIGARYSFEMKTNPHPEYVKLMDTFGKTVFNICWTCMILALGVPVVGGQVRGRAAVRPGGVKDHLELYVGGSD